jgi:hypothetical protein
VSRDAQDQQNRSASPGATPDEQVVDREDRLDRDTLSAPGE